MSQWEIFKLRCMRRMHEGMILLSEYIYREERPEVEPEIRLEGYLKERKRAMEQELV